MAALECAKNNLKVAVVSKVEPLRSHTAAAQGGINAPLGNISNDDWRWLMYDTIRGGDWLCDQDSVAFMCRNANAAIIELENMGVPFTRDETGRIYQRQYGGQSLNFGKGELAHRACAAADRTGHAILSTLYQQCIKAGVQFYNEFFALDLLVEKNTAGETSAINGLVALKIETGEVHQFNAATTIIASGGFGSAFEYTTSSSICTGDGCAMALRAGIPLKDMEFVQFHPTGIYGIGCLITEGARAEGAYLFNSKGERFMEEYAPKFKELASRDLISRMMIKEIHEGRGCGSNGDYIHLSLRHLPEEMVKSRLPTVIANARNFLRIDASKQDIPVVPTVHYTMGGIPTNWRGQVVIPAVNGADAVVAGLVAIGEAACSSIHGANRLGCNSLLDLIVFGKEAGKIASENRRGNGINNSGKYIIDETIHIKNQKSGLSIYELSKTLKNTASKYAGIYRNGEVLSAGISRALQVAENINITGCSDKSLMWNTELLELLELRNMSLLITAVIASASERKESRGAHFRDDYHARNDANFLKHTIFKDIDDIYFSPIRMNTNDSNAPSVALEERKY